MLAVVNLPLLLCELLVPLCVILHSGQLGEAVDGQLGQLHGLLIGLGLLHYGQLGQRRLLVHLHGGDGLHVHLCRELGHLHDDGLLDSSLLHRLPELLLGDVYLDLHEPGQLGAVDSC